MMKCLSVLLTISCVGSSGLWAGAPESSEKANAANPFERCVQEMNGEGADLSKCGGEITTVLPIPEFEQRVSRIEQCAIDKIQGSAQKMVRRYKKQYARCKARFPDEARAFESTHHRP